MYTIEEISKVDGDGFYFRIVKATNPADGAVTFNAIPYDDSGDKLTMFPIFKAPTLAQVNAYVANQI